MEREAPKDTTLEKQTSLSQANAEEGRKVFNADVTPHSRSTYPIQTVCCAVPRDVASPGMVPALKGDKPCPKEVDSGS